MSKYYFNKSKYGTHCLILRWLGQNKQILDVGCSFGYLGERSLQNRFYGIEVDEEAAERAKKFYQDVIVGDVEGLTDLPLSRKGFDIIIFADILEHLVRPEKTLVYLTNNFLKDNGRVVVSLPNTAHLSIRLKLLVGRFEYTEVGILDKTHLHFYTFKSAKKLISDSGLEVERISYSSNNFGWLLKKLPFLGTLLGFGFIFLCKRKSDGE